MLIHQDAAGVKGGHHASHEVPARKLSQLARQEVDRNITRKWEKSCKYPE